MVSIMMKANILGIITIGIIIFMVIGAGCSTKYSPTIEVSLGGGTQTTTPTEVPTTDIGIVKAGVLNYFMYKSMYGLPSKAGILSENTTMQNLAIKNAKQGLHSLKIKSSSPEKAVTIFEAYETDRIGDTITFWQHNSNVSGGTGSYGIGVYKDADYYNICIVFTTPQKPTTEVDSNGAYILIEHPDVIDYLWSEE
jgi:hypothetical protein